MNINFNNNNNKSGLHDPITRPPPPNRSELGWSTKQEEELRSLGGAVLTKPKLSEETVPDAAALNARLQLPHTGLWRVKCPAFGSVCRFFGPTLPPCACLLLLLRWLPSLLHLVPTVAAPPCILSSAPLPAAAGLYSGLSCCWCSLKKDADIDPARSRML